MPKYHLQTVGSFGDVIPIIGLAQALKNRGHEVEVATNSYFQDAVENEGLKFISLCRSEVYQNYVNNPKLFKQWDGIRTLGNIAAMHLENSYKQALQKQEDGYHVIASSLALGAKFSSIKTAIPFTSVSFAPTGIRSLTDPAKLNPWFPPPGFPKRLMTYLWNSADWQFRGGMGKTLRTFENDIGFRSSFSIIGNWSNSDSCLIALFPQWFCSPKPDWPKSAIQVDFPVYDLDQKLSDETLDFLQTGPKPLLFTPGTPNGFTKTFFDTAYEAVKKSGERAIFLSKNTTTRYPGILNLDFAPLGKLMPHIKGIFHHGGIGTCTQALRFGVAQVVYPFAFDQYDNGLYLQKLGSGSILTRKQWQVKRILKAIEDMPKQRSHADLFPQDPFAKTCDIIERQ